MDDIFQLTPEEGQMALIRALQARRTKPQATDTMQGWGNLALMSGDRALTGFGQSQIAQAGDISQTKERSIGRAFSAALEAGKEERQRREQLSDTASQRAWQDRRDELARKNHLEEAAILAGQKREEKKADKVVTDTKELAEDLDKIGAPAFYSKAGEVSTIVNDPKYADDLPGVGPLEGKLPDWLVSDEGKNLRQAAGQMLAEYRKGITGSGMSQGEKEEYSQITGLMNGGNEKSYVEGFKRLQRAMDARVGARAAGTPEAAETYATRQPWMKEALGRGAGKDSGPAKIGSDAEYDALPSGTEFIDPEGKRRRKP